MFRRLPIIPTIVVAVAVAAMIALGVWQLLIRAPEKDALLAKYVRAEGQPPIIFPARTEDGLLPLFRHATAMCARVVGRHAQAGENLAGEPGYVQLYDCYTPGDHPVLFTVEAGWSKDPNARVTWAGGPVSGVIAPDRRTRMRLVAGTAPQGLEPSAPPSLATIPNNHRFYALQWFAFAVIAMVIYGLAVRKRLNAQ
jgi:surfeit locus 1 family protein